MPGPLLRLSLHDLRFAHVAAVVLPAARRPEGGIGVLGLVDCPDLAAAARGNAPWYARARAARACEALVILERSPARRAKILEAIRRRHPGLGAAEP